MLEGGRNRFFLDTKHREYLEDFHKQYVLVPADKAANNVKVVCKKHYLDVVLSELQVNNHSNGHTYSEVTIDCHSIINKHLVFGIFQFHLNFSNYQRYINKMHKTPYSSRFIATSN